MKKARSSKYHDKEIITYAEIDENDQESDIVFEYVEENEVNLAELKPGHPYVCKVLRPSNGKKIMSNLVKMKNSLQKCIRLI